MVVGAVDHPRHDEPLLSGQVGQHPGARLRQGRQRGGDRDGFHAGTADQARDGVLQLVVAEHLRLAEEERKLRRKCGPALHDALDGVHQVIHVHEGLAVRRRAGVEPAGEVTLIDALDLVRQRDRVAQVVVDAGDAQQHGRDVASLVADELLGPDLRRRVRPGRLERPVFREELARLPRPVHEHRAREDELLHPEAELPQPAQEAGRAMDGDLLVLWARPAEEIIVCGEMDHRGDVRPVMVTDGAEPVPHALVGRDVDRDIHAAWRRRLGRLAVEPDDLLEKPGEPSHHGVADPSVGTAEDDDPAVRVHGLPSRPRDGIVARALWSRGIPALQTVCSRIAAGWHQTCLCSPRNKSSSSSPRMSIVPLPSDRPLSCHRQDQFESPWLFLLRSRSSCFNPVPASRRRASTACSVRVASGVVSLDRVGHVDKPGRPNGGLLLELLVDNDDKEDHYQDANHRPKPHPSAHPSVSWVHHKDSDPYRESHRLRYEGPRGREPHERAGLSAWCGLWVRPSCVPWLLCASWTCHRTAGEFQRGDWQCSRRPAIRC